MRHQTVMDGISLGKIQIPELHNIVPDAFGKHEGSGCLRIGAYIYCRSSGILRQYNLEVS